jgi:hypothetical protein
VWLVAHIIDLLIYNNNSSSTQNIRCIDEHAGTYTHTRSTRTQQGTTRGNTRGSGARKTLMYKEASSAAKTEDAINPQNVRISEKTRKINTENKKG